MNEPVSRKRTSIGEMSATRGANDCPTPTKRGYDTRADAKRVARKFHAKGRRPGAKLVPYLCACGFFHVGNQPSNAKREQMEGA